MIKVCHLTSAHKANDIRIFVKECVSLAKAGYEVYLVAPNARNEVREGVNIIGVPVKGYGFLYRIFCSSRLIYRKTLEIDANLYHFHDIELFKYGVRLKKKGKKVIFDSHEDWIGYAENIEWLPAVFKKVAVFNIRRWYKKYLNLFDAVITVTPHIVEKLKGYTEKVSMVTNYPIVDADDLVICDEREYMNRENSICYAGTVYKASNQEATIRAINEIKEVKYVLVGEISPKDKTELEAVAGWEKVEFINKVPMKELKRIYNRVLAGMVIFDYIPNIGGKMGTLGSNKMFEYMMAGLPIICSDQDLWVDLIRRYKCGFCVSPGNVSQIREAVLGLLKDKKTAFEMGRNARRAVLEEFNWKNQEEVLLELYRKVC